MGNFMIYDKKFHLTTDAGNGLGIFTTYCWLFDIFCTRLWLPAGLTPGMIMDTTALDGDPRDTHNRLLREVLADPKDFSLEVSKSDRYRTQRLPAGARQLNCPRCSYATVYYVPSPDGSFFASMPPRVVNELDIKTLMQYV